jgi:hypothetical protein
MQCSLWRQRRLESQVVPVIKWENYNTTLLLVTTGISALKPNIIVSESFLLTFSTDFSVKRLQWNTLFLVPKIYRRYIQLFLTVCVKWTHSGKVVITSPPFSAHFYLSNYLSIYPSIHVSMALQPFVGFDSFFCFLIFYTVGSTPWKRDQPVTRLQPTHRTT